MFEQIDEANTIDELNEKERFWIGYYNATNRNKGYNLDSGGRNGGVKSDETKKKIGLTTKEKWNNPETAAKMKAGLQKGAETMKRNAIRVPFICPVCKNTFYYEKAVAQKRKYCSNKCAGIGGSWIKGVINSGIVAHNRNLERKIPIKNDIHLWVENNLDTTITCPYNKISTTLIGLKDMLMEKYNIKDFRTVFICFDNVTNLKGFLDKLKEYAYAYISKENVC